MYARTVTLKPFDTSGTNLSQSVCILDLRNLDFIYHQQGVQHCLTGLRFGNDGKFGDWPLAKIVYKFGGKLVTNVTSRLDYLIIGKDPRPDRVERVCDIIDICSYIFYRSSGTSFSQLCI